MEESQVLSTSAALAMFRDVVAIGSPDCKFEQVASQTMETCTDGITSG